MVLDSSYYCGIVSREKAPTKGFPPIAQTALYVRMAAEMSTSQKRVRMLMSVGRHAREEDLRPGCPSSG